MQASTSRAGLAHLTRSLVSSKTLPPCTCGAVNSARKSSTLAAEGTPRATSQQTLAGSSTATPHRTLYTGRSQAEKLANRDERSHVALDGLSHWVTPNDVRRLIAQRMGNNANDVKEVVMLPTIDMRPTGRAIVEFTWAVKAKEAVDKLRGKTSSGLVEDYLDCRLLDISRPPYSRWLTYRKPLSSRAAVYDAFNEGPPNLKAGLQYSGRAVVISGFPATIHPLSILERLNKEGFYPVKAPGLGTGWAAMDEIVHLKIVNAQREEKFVNYLVRLPSKAEAHRLASSWNATWPKGAMMNGEVRINAQIVW